MSEKAFGKIRRGLEEAKTCMEGEREGYKFTVPPSLNGKSNPAKNANKARQAK